jgi:hypothetical protein
MIVRYVVLRRRIESELVDVLRAATKAGRALERARRSGEDADYYRGSTFGEFLEAAGHADDLAGPQT